MFTLAPHPTNRGVGGTTGATGAAGAGDVGDGVGEVGRGGVGGWDEGELGGTLDFVSDLDLD